jgi:hypothetical protein
MPSAFNVANSPITSAGTLAVTAAGVASQYIRGDGALADFPTNGGGGSSVSYYLNGSVSQGTFVGNTYYEMNKTPVIGTGTDFTIGANGYIAQFITDANDPASLLIPAGNWNVEMYFSASSNGGNPSFYVEVYKYNGTTFTLLGTSSATPEGITNGTAIDIYYTSVGIPETVLTITDRLAIRVYVTHSGRTITLHTEDNHLSEIITTFSNGINTLNGLTKQAQYFAVGSTGTDFAISSSVDTHTFNLPTASATNRGALSSGDWSTFNSKQGTITLTTTGTSGAATFIANTLNIPNYADGGILSLSAIGASPNANAATITGTVLNLEPASASFGGVVTTGTQTFAGDKTLTGSLYGIGLSMTGTSGDIIGSVATSGKAIRGTATTGFGVYSSATTGTAIYGESTGTGGAGINGTAGNGIGGYFLNNATGFATLYVTNNGSGNLANFSNSAGTKFTINNAGNLGNGTYTYTLPSATGTLALVGGAGVGTVTSVAALTLGTSGTDLSSTVANGTTTPVITLNVPDASATARGVVTTGTQTFAGAKTLTGALAGTSATFSGDIRSSAGIFYAADGTAALPSIRFWNNSTGFSNSSGALVVSTESVARLTIASTGAATFSGVLKSIASGAYAGGNEQIGAGIVSSAALATVQAVARFSNYGNGYVTKIILSDNSIADAVISFEPSGTATSSLLGFGSGTAKQLTIDGNGKVTLTGALSGTSATFSGDVGINTSTPDIIGYGTKTFGILGVGSDFPSLQIGIPGTAAATTGPMGDINFFSKNATGAVVSRSVIRSSLDGATNSNFFSFFTMNAGSLAERMRITSTGNVGIGTTTMNQFVNIKSQSTTTSLVNITTSDSNRTLNIGVSSSAGYVMMENAASLILGTSGVTALTIASTGAATFSSSVKTGTAADNGISGEGVVINANVNGVRLVTAQSTNTYETLAMYSSGAGAYRFYVGWGGTIYATSTTITAISDQRLKENIRPLNNGLSIIDRLNPVMFDWKEGKGLDKKNDVGFIAQEFEKVFPNSVTESLAGDDGISYKALNHGELIPTLVKAIQELKAEIDLLKNK